MARRCREFYWAGTSLGSPDEWPDALRIAVRMALETPFPINLWCGPEMRLIYNDAYRSVLGAKHPDALGRPGADVWSEIWSDIEGIFDRIRRGGPAEYAEDARFEMERDHGPPGEAWFTYSVSAIRSDDGQIVAFLNIASETTRRLMAERAAQRDRAAAEHAERQLREVFAQAPAFLAVLRGTEHRFEFVNDAYRRLIGNRDVEGKRVVDALPEVVSQGFIEILDKVLRNNEPFVGRALPVQLQRSTGGALEDRYVDFVYQPLCDAHGTPTGIVAHGVDVTDQVLARQVMEESESRYRFLANSIPVQVWTATAEGALDYVSDRGAEYFGRSAAEVVGDQWLSVLHPDDVEGTLTRWRHSLETGKPYEVEFRLFSARHNEYRWHLSRANAQCEGGRILRWVGTNTEIEDRKRFEAELQRLTAEATEADKAKSAFLASMSHELRTPLNAIGGYAQLIEMGVRGPVNDAQRQDLLKIQRSKNHLDTLVSDVLNFAKLGAGRMEYRVDKVNVRLAVSTVADMVAPQMAEKKLELRIDPMAREVFVRADEDKVRQILLNLLGNALKFTAEHGVITVSLHEEPTTVTVEVTDTGIGVPEEHLDRIFEPFVQSKRALNSKDQGVGLGLAISRQYARAMGGDLKVRSKPGLGSTFSMSLPRY
ncbi:MAG TPA: ATP-binding protein [Gemmatimonadaceae bacterium]|nr:ATP-binding protein [Gemmatimonadaceae bacterium]